MNDNANVYIALRGHVPEVTDYLVLQVKLGVALRLVGQHELQVVDADQLDIVSVDGMIEGLHDVFEVGRSVEVEEMEWVLGELLQGQLCQIGIT
jgi:hypothetical protein